MTKNPITIETADSVARAIDLLQSLPIRHLPVIDERGVLVGMVSDRDLGALMKAAFIEGAETEEMQVPPAQRVVADLMSIDPVALPEDADVLEVVDTMLSERVGAIPIVDDADRVTGIISYVDLLDAFYRGEIEPEEAGRKRQPPITRRST